MKSLEEIKKTPRLMVLFAGEDGGMAEAFLLSSKKARPATVVFSWGGGWDHVSVGFRNRTPTWEEMCEVKNMFFHPEEVAWEYHPMDSEYVNNHPYCLHIWRYQQEGIPMPPTWMVGARKGQMLSEAYKEGMQELAAGGLAPASAPEAALNNEQPVIEYGA